MQYCRSLRAWWCTEHARISRNASCITENRHQPPQAAPYPLAASASSGAPTFDLVSSFRRIFACTSAFVKCSTSSLWPVACSLISQFRSSRREIVVVEGQRDLAGPVVFVTSSVQRQLEAAMLFRLTCGPVSHRIV